MKFWQIDDIVYPLDVNRWEEITAGTGIAVIANNNTINFATDRLKTPLKTGQIISIVAKVLLNNPVITITNSDNGDVLCTNARIRTQDDPNTTPLILQANTTIVCVYDVDSSSWYTPNINRMATSAEGSLGTSNSLYVSPAILKSVLDARLAEIITTLEDLTSRVGTNTTDIATLKSEVLAVQQWIDGFNNFDPTEIANKVNSLEEALTEVNTTIAELEVTINDAVTQINNALLEVGGWDNELWENNDLFYFLARTPLQVGQYSVADTVTGMPEEGHYWSLNIINRAADETSDQDDPSTRLWNTDFGLISVYQQDDPTNVYERHCINYVWSDWIKLSNYVVIDEAIDLGVLTKPGTYHITNSGSTSLPNLTLPATVTVTGDGITNCKQFLIVNNGYMYDRIGSSSNNGVTWTFTSWYQMVMTSGSSPITYQEVTTNITSNTLNINSGQRHQVNVVLGSGTSFNFNLSGIVNARYKEIIVSVINNTTGTVSVTITDNGVSYNVLDPSLLSIAVGETRVYMFRAIYGTWYISDALVASGVATFVAPQVPYIAVRAAATLAASSRNGIVDVASPGVLTVDNGLPVGFSCDLLLNLGAILTVPSGVTLYMRGSQNSSTSGANFTIPYRAYGTLTKITTTTWLFGNSMETATSSLYGADYAEYYKVAGDHLQGTLLRVSLDSEYELEPTQGPDDFVVGVISTEPGMVVNVADRGKEGYIEVGLVGKVPTRVKGSINKGDKISASEISGVAKVASKKDRVIGAALVTDTSEDVRKVMCVIKL